MKLRSQLVLLALATLLPVAILAATLGAFLIEQQRKTFRLGAEERTLALLTAVDAELRGSIDAIKSLSQVASLNEGDLRFFRRTAARVLESNPQWTNINLALPDRRRVLDLLAAEGASLPPITDDGEVAELLQTGKPVIANLAAGPVSNRWNYAVRVPVIRDGTITYILSAVVRPEPMAELVAAQNLPAGWGGVVLDRNNRIVAATVEPEKSRGQLAPQSLRDALMRAPSGWFRGRTIEGAEVYTPYRRSPASGWTFAMAIPRQAVDATATRAIWIFALTLMGVIVVAFGLARLVGRRIAEPIAALAAATDRLAKGERVVIKESSRLRELRSLEAALSNAAGAQTALKRAEEQTRSIVDHVIDGIITIDEGGTIESFNRAAERLFGYGASEVIGKNIKLLMPEPYRSAHEGFIGNYLRTAQAKIIGIGREVVGQRKDGSTFPMDLAVGEFRLDEKRYFTGIVRDITERKRAEQELRSSEERLRKALAAIKETESRFRVMADSSPIMIWVVDTEAHIQFINRAYREFFGVQLQDVLGPNWQPLVHPEDAPHYVSSFLDSLRFHKAWTARARVRRADGQWRWIESRSNPRFSASGEYLGAVGSSPDITEQVERERALREADRHKDEFLAMLSHELRNPLAALTTAADVLHAAASDNPIIADTQGVIDRQTKHMVRLTEDLLDITRLRLGKLSLKREAVDLGDLVSQVTESKRTAGTLDGRAKVAVDASSVWLQGDRTRLEQVYANLLDNALKFTPANGSIKISVRRQAEVAILSVADNGRGIPPDMLPIVFELFVQGEQNLDRAQGGLGLGLPLVRRLAELHGGKVSAKSAGVGCGATFTVSLPAMEAPNEPPRGTAPSRPVARKLRILIVEDNPDARQMLRAALAMEGHDVHEAADGVAAIAAAKEIKPDVVLLDIGLPDIDGYEVARRLRAAPGGGSIILLALSGYGREDDRGRAQAAGFDAHLVKPASADRIFAVITDLLARTPVG